MSACEKCWQDAHYGPEDARILVAVTMDRINEVRLEAFRKE